MDHNFDHLCLFRFPGVTVTILIRSDFDFRFPLLCDLCFIATIPVSRHSDAVLAVVYKA